jgi:hypothetical protein
MTRIKLFNAGVTALVVALFGNPSTVAAQPTAEETPAAQPAAPSTPAQPAADPNAAAPAEAAPAAAPSGEEPSPTPSAETPAAEPAETPATEPAEAPEEAPAADEEAPLVILRVHVISTRNTYEKIEFDVISVATREVVARGQGANEGIGEDAPFFELEPGIYKLVKAGEPFDTRVDFATINLDKDTDFLVVVDPDTGAFRGSGTVTDELPHGLEIAGVRLALNVGGTLWLNQRRAVVGNTNGVSALAGVFGNFGMVYDEGNHFLSVESRLQLNLRDPVTAGMFATTDYFEGSALYAYNINNPYIGPYARAGFKTRAYYGYLYLASEDESVGSGTVTVNRLNSPTPDVYQFGTEAHPDDLRIQVAKPFAPFILQEEIGANLKALDLDLRLLEVSVATRLGWGLRQGLTNGLLVVRGSERGDNIVLDEVDDYATNGPVLGANANVTFARWLFGQGQFGMMVPLQNRADAGPDVASRILMDLSGTAGLKLPALTSSSTPRLITPFVYNATAT